MMKHQLDAPLSLKEASMGIEFPPEIEKLVARLLEKSPLNRYKNAQMLTAELVKIEQELGETESIAAVSSPSKIGKSSDKFDVRSFVRNYGLTLLLMILCYLLGLLTNFLRHSEHQLDKTSQTRFDAILASSLFPKGDYKRPASSAVETGKQPYFSEISKDGKSRLFKFPEKSIGDMMVDEKIIPARGNVSLPINQLVIFRPAAIYLDSPLLLQRFRPEELYGLHLIDEVRTSIDVLKILPVFKNLHNLQVAIDVDDRALPYIDQLPQLQVLDVSNTHITGDGISRLKQLPNLYYLDCSAIDHLEPLMKMLPTTRLQSFTCESAHLKEEDLKMIGQVKTLVELNLRGNEGIDDKALLQIRNLKEMKTLSLGICPITAKSIPVLTGFKKLERLQLSKSSFNEKQIEQLKKSTRANIDFRGQPQFSPIIKNQP